MWILILALILFAFGVLVYFFGADSRPGFSDGRTDRKDPLPERLSHSRF